MSLPSTFDRIARDVIAHYPPALVAASWTPLGNAGGFSGARIWRGELADQRCFCLRAWPFGRISEGQLRGIHSAIAACRLPIVPELVPLWGSQETLVHCGGQLWEITSWMPGTADFRERPSDARLFAAVRALAQIHLHWKPSRPRFEPCPAVGRIVRALEQWRALVQTGWKPDFTMPFSVDIRERAKRAWKVLAPAAIGLEFEFAGWDTRPLPVQICLCDIWHDHVLFEGDEVSGVIDFGAVKLDCVAIDLARLLGSLIPDEPDRMNMALAVYSAIKPVPDDVLRLVPILDRVGSVIGLSNWVRWLYLEKRLFSESAQIVRRMDALLKRLEQRAEPSSWFWDL
jgi:Ser/Thr protein kinase RdoA (MazF antagonist)